MRDFKPSDVILCVPVPFVGTYDKAEVEIAAGMVVHGLAERGDEWRGIEWSELQEVLKAALDAGQQPWKSLVTNPFVRPDFHRLVDKGYAKWDSEPGKSPLVLTDAAFERMPKWYVSRAYRRIIGELFVERAKSSYGRMSPEREAEYAGRLDDHWKKMNEDQQKAIESEFAEARQTLFAGWNYP